MDNATGKAGFEWDGRAGVLASDAVSEWVEWHGRYDSDAGLIGRLRLVEDMIRDALDARRAGLTAIISICAGD